MPDASKPLFSRPALAAVMLLSTLAIWLLNLTAPSTNLPTPNIKTWSTESGIPVTWLSQSQWENSNKLEIRLVFNAEHSNPAIIRATLDMLLGDSLPLSTASINQRFSPLAARALSHYDTDNQIIGVTMNNEPDYLIPSLSLMTRWLQTPDFKPRSFDQWQRQQQTALSAPQSSWQPFSAKPVANFSDLSLDQVKDYYQSLKNAAASIIIIGHMTSESEERITRALNTISQDYRRSPPNPPVMQSETMQNPNNQTVRPASTMGAPWQSQSAVELKPISSVEEWLSLQIWGTDLVATLNQQAHIDFVQLALNLSVQPPWVWWQTQYRNTLTLEPNTIQEANSEASMKSLALLEPLPSTRDPEHFQALMDAFKAQLAQQTLSPTWWSDIATQVTHEGGAFTLEKFAADYQDAITRFTIEDYQSALETLLKPSSYQEIQVYQ